jgi:hypothetical protein
MENSNKKIETEHFYKYDKEKLFLSIESVPPNEAFLSFYLNSMARTQRMRILAQG